MRVLLSVVLAAALVACEPTTTAPVQVMAMVISNTGEYEPRPVQLATVRDVVGLNGDAARLVGGARIYVDESEPLFQSAETDAQRAQVMIKSPGLEPRASYVERDGVLWPADFHTWNMVTTYFNFEKAFVYFQDNGVTRGEMIDSATGSGPTVYYFPSFTLAGLSADALQDNALYFSPIFAFAVLPFDTLQSVPLSMNSGVIAHEYAHRVFNVRAYGGAAVPLPFNEQWLGTVTAHVATNMLKGFDEGLADFHAFGASCAQPLGCTTRFLEPSIGAPATDLRDFAKPGLCMDNSLRNAINTLQIGGFTGQGMDYRLGTVLSAALRKAAFPSKLQTMQRALLAAYDDQDATKPGFRQIINGNAQTPQLIRLSHFAKSILQHITDPDLKIDTCNAFIDHLQIPKDEMVAPPGEAIACPAQSANPGTCPNIN